MLILNNYAFLFMLSTLERIVRSEIAIFSTFSIIFDCVGMFRDLNAGLKSFVFKIINKI